MHDDDEKTDSPIVWGILSPVLDWTAEQRAAAEPEIEYDNVIWLERYTLH
jgi:hypothetical protein